MPAGYYDTKSKPAQLQSPQHNSQSHQHKTASQSQSQKQKQTPLQDKEMERAFEYEELRKQLRKQLRNAGIHKEYKWKPDEKPYDLRDFAKMAQKRSHMDLSNKAHKSGGKSRRKHTRKSKRKSCRKSCRR
jgi:hypothetical protein